MPKDKKGQEGLKMSLLNLTRCQTGCDDIDPGRKFNETVVAPSDLNRIAEE